MKGHSGNLHNEEADKEAKQETESPLEYIIKTTLPILTDLKHQPITMDPKQWLKKHHQLEHLLQW